MESQNGGTAPPQRDTKRVWVPINSATKRTARRKRSRPTVQTTWTQHASWQTKQDYNPYIDELHARLADTWEHLECGENYMEDLQIKLDEAQWHADEVQENDVHGESQQLADAQERIRGLEEDLANTGVELRGEMIKVEWFTRRVLELEKSELNKRIEEEQISNSWDRKSLEEEWKTKLEKEKREHDLELKHLKEEVRSGNQIRESLEQRIKRGEKYLEQRKEELLEKSRQFKELQGEMRK